MNLSDSLDSLKGIGEKTRNLFEKVGVHNLAELLGYYPRTYEQYKAPVPIQQINDGDIVSVNGRIVSAISSRHIRGLSITSAQISDGTGLLSITWFNMPYLRNSLKTNVSYVFRGRIKLKGQQLLMEQPAVFRMEEYEKLSGVLRPVYPLIKGLSSQMIQKAVKQVLSDKSLQKDYLPEEYRKRYHLSEYNYAIEQIHFPKDQHELSLARIRLAFDEFFMFLIQLRKLKTKTEKAENPYQIHVSESARAVLQNLPFQLTNAQMQVWKKIEQELSGPTCMSRLIQGDVGSGKTIVSLLALIMTAESGYQGALMVPTEVLARQHFDAVNELIKKNDLPFQAALLTGSMTARQRREVYASMESGAVSIIIGTHALIQEKAVYHNLALVITDEQHRFGVRQREMLSMKGENPHILVMSATPIPRTLAVILYGDLDISVINELPANRLPIKNCVVGTGYRPKAYAFIQRQVEEGHQAYVICPMVEESEAIDAESVVEYTEVLKSKLPASIQIEYLHGKMKPSEKNEIMDRFLRNDIQVLVSTTVVEVGVNVPNATVMMIENAERFGLAQLHQLRGRVGRGDAQSYCIFMYGSDGNQTKERLDILNKSNDGFEIANRDMQLRGPGDLFGIRQSGMLDFQLADIFSDAPLLQQANEAVNDLMEKDPDLVLEEHNALRQFFDLMVQNQNSNINL